MHRDADNVVGYDGTPWGQFICCRRKFFIFPFEALVLPTELEGVSMWLGVGGLGHTLPLLVRTTQELDTDRSQNYPYN